MQGVPCEAWHIAEDQNCRVNYTFVVIVAFISALSFCTVGTLSMTLRLRAARGGAGDVP